MRLRKKKNENEISHKSLRSDKNKSIEPGVHSTSKFIAQSQVSPSILLFFIL